MTERLLRLCKALPSALPSQRAYAYLATTAFPLFPAHLHCAGVPAACPAGS